jgi:hypothetical protein
VIEQCIRRDFLQAATYNVWVNWDIEVTHEFTFWWNDLTSDQQDIVTIAVEKLGDHGPNLGRPYADHVEGSRHQRMKELRPRPGNLRILFAFDPRRTAILLLGGDKTGAWSDWYRRMIPRADELYDRYLEDLRKEGLL